MQRFIAMRMVGFNRQRVAKWLVASLVGGISLGTVSSVALPLVASALPIDQPISAKYSHSCAIFNGAAKCWGANSDGSLGDGSTTNRSSPVQVVGLTSGVTSIASGYDFSCAVQNSFVKCWGSNVQGQLGNGSNIASNVPVTVFNLAGVTAVSAGTQHACAISNTALVCWGLNSDAQLGDGTVVNRNAPQNTQYQSGVSSVSLGGSGSCIVVNGAARCWGRNTYGETGVVIASGVTAVAAGGDHTCAIVSGGAKCWGNNTWGGLGDGTTTASTTPVQVLGLTTGVTAIDASVINTTCAVVGGAAKCWGYNRYGAIGNGGSATAAVPPTQVVGLTSAVTGVTTSGGHSCAVVATVAKCWGTNIEGRLGDGTLNDSYVPVDVGNQVPAAPSYTGVDVLSSSSVRIRWLDNSNNEDGFAVYRIAGSSVLLVPGCAGTQNATSCTDVGLSPGTYYQYYVYAYNNSGPSFPGASILTYTPPDLPTAPVVVSAIANGPHQVDVNWIDTSTNELGFKVYRYAPGGNVLEATVAPNSTSASFTDLGIDTNVFQVFFVVAYNAAGQTFSDTYIFTSARRQVSSPPLLAAGLLGATSVNSTSVTLNWIDRATTELGYVVYRVDAASMATLVCSTGPNATSCTDAGLVAGSYYQYLVYSWNGAGSADPGTAIVVHTPKPLPAPLITASFAIGANQIAVQWQDRAADETGYSVYRYNSDGTSTEVATLGPNTTSHIVTGLTANTTYVFYVTVKRSAETSYSPNAIWATTTL
jgi:alpha-tubulin suppressor-like RCC1 family protein